MKMDEKNKIKFGLKNVHYGVMNEAADGTISYGTPVPIPGAVSLSLEAEGEETTFYADNQKYHNEFSNDGYAGDLEIADTPESFKTDILGEVKDSNGALTEMANATIKRFALMFQIEGDKKGRRFVYYNTTVSRPAIEAKTIEKSKEPNTDKLSVSASARADGKVRAVLEESTSNKAVYDNFFKDVYDEDETEQV